MPTYRLEPEPTTATGDITAGDAAARGRDVVLLGKLAESGPQRSLWLDVSGEQVIAVLGKRGTGKSYTLGVVIEGLSAGGGGNAIAKLSTPRAALVLDIMDIFWTSQIKLSADGSAEVVKQYEVMRKGGLKTQELCIDVWVPAGFERPNLDPSGTRRLFLKPSDLELDDWGALFGLDIYGEPRGMLIADIIGHVSRDGYTNTDGSFVRPNPDFQLTELLDCLDMNGDISANYSRETIRGVRQRLQTYAALPLFSGPATSLSDLLRPFRSSVLMMARVPDALKKVLVAVLLRRILRERRDASFARKRLDLSTELSKAEKQGLGAVLDESIPRTWVLMDEAHVLCGVDEDSIARDALVKYAKEGRNYGLSLAVATQQPSALDPRLMSQVETLIVHQLTAPRDAAVAKSNMRSPVPTTIKVDGADADVEAMLRRLGQGMAAFSSGNAPNLSRLCVATIRPRITAHGGYEA